MIPVWSSIVATQSRSIGEAQEVEGDEEEETERDGVEDVERASRGRSRVCWIWDRWRSSVRRESTEVAGEGGGRRAKLSERRGR
jgi:hypothetical protein